MPRSRSTSTFGGNITLTSVTAWESTDDKSRGDIDGGVWRRTFLAPGATDRARRARRRAIRLHSILRHMTQDGIDDLDQYTQEIRFAIQATDRLFWQAGVYYFDSKFRVTTNPFFVAGRRRLTHKNTAWAAFGHVSYDVTDALHAHRRRALDG